MISTLSTLALKAQTVVLAQTATCNMPICNTQGSGWISKLGPVRGILGFVGAVVGFVLIFRAVKSLLSGRISEVIKHGVFAVLAFAIAFNPDLITGLIDVAVDVFDYVKKLLFG